MSDKDRAAFEAWAATKGYISVIGGVKAFAPICHNTYEAWQASAARYQSRIAELEAALRTMVDNFGPTPSEKVKGLAEARAALKGGA